MDSTILEALLMRAAEPAPHQGEPTNPNDTAGFSVPDAPEIASIRHSLPVLVLRIPPPNPGPEDRTTVPGAGHVQGFMNMTEYVEEQPGEGGAPSGGPGRTWGDLGDVIGIINAVPMKILLLKFP